MTPDPQSFATTYEPVLMRCSCTCGWSRYVVTAEHGDKLLEEHTLAHEALAKAGVA